VSLIGEDTKYTTNPISNKITNNIHSQGILLGVEATDGSVVSPKLTLNKPPKERTPPPLISITWLDLHGTLPFHRSPLLSRIDHSEQPLSPTQDISLYPLLGTIFKSLAP